MTFLGGPHACIGYRFSLVESVPHILHHYFYSILLLTNRMKALLFTLIRAFEFELAVSSEEIIKKSAIVQRPLLKSDPKAGNQMPLFLRPVNRA